MGARDAPSDAIEAELEGDSSRLGFGLCALSFFSGLSFFGVG